MDQNECIICFENLYDFNISVLKCGHFFHSKCIKKWSEKNNTCPLCNKNIIIDHILFDSNKNLVSSNNLKSNNKLKSSNNYISRHNDSYNCCDNFCCLFSPSHRGQR